MWQQQSLLPKGFQYEDDETNWKLDAALVLKPASLTSILLPLEWLNLLNLPRLHQFTMRIITDYALSH